MNKKIIALLLSLVMILCQSTMCFGEELVQVLALNVQDGADVVISGNTWSEFTVKNASYSVEDGIAKFVADQNKRGNNEYITADVEVSLADYSQAVIKLKYTGVESATSRAGKDGDFDIPLVRLELECSVGAGVEKKVIDAVAVSGNEDESYTTADYVEVTFDLTQIDSYSSLSVNAVNIYPIYGFKTGAVDIETLTIKSSGTSSGGGEDGEEAEELVWNFDTADEVAQWAPNNAAQIQLSHDSNGYLKYVSTVTSSSGWMTSDVNFAPGKYNRIKYRAKIENYEPTSVSAAGSAPFLEMYYSCIKADGSTQGPKGGHSKSRSYSATLGGDGLYSSNWVEYEIDISTINGWSDAQTITQIRLDAAKNASGTVYFDYIKLYYYEPEPIEPDEPDEPVNPDIPDDPTVPEDPDKPEDPVTEGEQWYEYNFDTSEDASRWVVNNKDQASITWLDGGYIKYVSTPTTSASGTQQSGWATSAVDFDGNQYYKLTMRAKLENYSRSFSGNESPYFTIYYTGINASGVSQKPSSSFAMNVKYQGTEDEKGLFNSDWVEYEINLGNLNGWSNMQSVSEFRIDFVKNAAGTVYFDYIRLQSLPAIEKLTCNEVADADMQKVPTDVKTIEAYVSDTFNKITENDIAIYEKSDGEEKVYVSISKVEYNAASGKIKATISDELLSNTGYVFEIRDTAMINSKQTLYKPVAKEFCTDASSFEVEVTDLQDGSALVKYINTGSQKNVVLIATAWSGDKYMGKVILPVAAGNGITEELIDFSSLGGDVVEIITWEFNNSAPVVYGKKVVEITR